jgi:CubicO group peptidase (beta-lactamase class C family)
MKHFFLSLLSILVIISTNAQLAKDIGTIDKLVDSIQSIVKKRNIPGLMICITTRDSVLFSGGFGYADMGNKRHVNNQTLFRMGSITKTVVAIAILKLAEQGKLNLNTSLKEIAPEVPFINAWEKTHPVRIINLLEHTTGFDDFKFNNMYRLECVSHSTKEMMLQQKASMVCRWRPSERYTYSNVNYTILGYIISKLSGQEYDKYLAENILANIGMKGSNFNTWSRYPDLDTKEYAEVSGEMSAVPSVTLLPAAAAALWSNADDMNRFVQFFLRNGTPVLSKESMVKMELPTTSLAARAGLKSGYAMGNQDFGAMRGHDGALGTCKSSFRYNREMGYGFVISSNGNGLANIEQVINDFLNKRYGTREMSKDYKIQVLDKKQLEPFLGYYQAEDPRFDLMGLTDRLMMLKVELVNDTLQFNILGRKHQLLQLKPLLFIQKGTSQPEVAFAVNAAGKRVMILNRRYAEQVGTTTALVWRIAIAISIFFAAVSVVLGLGAFVYYSISRHKSALHGFIMPMLSMAGLGWGIYFFLKVFNNGYLLFQLASVSIYSISIFSGFSLFAIGTLLNAYLLIKQWRNITNPYIKIMLVLTSLSLLLLTCILTTGGWIGLRTWKM